jgi:tetratricopeptide (TPR) repeat protein
VRMYSANLGEKSTTRLVSGGLLISAVRLLKMQKYGEAVADSEKGIMLDPRMSAAHLNRGAGTIGLERYNDALASLNQAIDLGSDNLQLIYFDRGLAKENLGDVKGAYYDYRKAVELDPSFQLAIHQLSRFAVTTR